MGSVVVLNTCLFVVLLSNAREGGGGRGVPNNGKRGYITRQKESQLTAKRGRGGREGEGGVLLLCFFDSGRHGTPF